jgi:hypothetical protein
MLLSMVPAYVHWGMLCCTLWLCKNCSQSESNFEANASNPGRGVSKVDIQLVSSICLSFALFVSVSKHAVMSLIFSK